MRTFCSRRCKQNYVLGKRMFVPTGTTDQNAYLGGVHSPDGTEGTGTRDDNDKGVTSITPLTALDELKDQKDQVQEEQDVKITDVEKDEEVRCNICFAYIGGEDALQCQVWHAWVCNDCIEIDGDELDESKFRCWMCADRTTPEPDVPEPKKPRKSIKETVKEAAESYDDFAQRILSEEYDLQEYVQEIQKVQCCSCSDWHDKALTDKCSRCKHYMCWQCITYYRCMEFGLVKGSFVCECCADIHDYSSTDESSDSSSMSSDSEESPLDLRRTAEFPNFSRLVAQEHLIPICPNEEMSPPTQNQINSVCERLNLELMTERLMTTGPLSQDSTLAYTQGPEEILKYYTSAYKRAEKKKSKGRSKKRK